MQLYFWYKIHTIIIKEIKISDEGIYMGCISFRFQCQSLQANINYAQLCMLSNSQQWCMCTLRQQTIKLIHSLQPPLPSTLFCMCTFQIIITKRVKSAHPHMI